MFARRVLPWCLATLLAIPALSFAQQTVYRWVDKDGKVVFSDTPPPKEITTSSQKRVGGGFVETSNVPYANQVAMKNSPITLYTTTDCGSFCEQARGLLSRRGVPYNERDAGGDKAAAEAVQRLVGQFIVPVLTVGENKLKGFDEASWQAALDAAGYLRTPLPGYQPPPPAKAMPRQQDAPAAAAPAATPEPDKPDIEWK